MPADFSDRHAATTLYSDRLPSPPRIDVPMHMAALPAKPMPVFKPRPDGLFDGYTIDSDFMTFDWSDWDYTRRRQAQAVLPFLFLGPTSVRKDVQYLQAAGITMMLIIRHARPGQFPGRSSAATVLEDLGVACTVLDIIDNQALSNQFTPAIATINAHLAAVKARSGALGKVLVTDDTGNERAAALVVAYMMQVTDYALVPTIQFVQMQRFCINIDDALKYTLQAFEDLLKARSDVGLPAPDARPARRQSIMCNLPVAADASTRRSSEKRTLDDMQADEIIVDDDGDAIMDPHYENGALDDRGRRDFTPFADG